MVDCGEMKLKQTHYMCLYCTYTWSELMDNTESRRNGACESFVSEWHFAKAGFLVGCFFFSSHLACLPSCETLMAVVHHSSAIACRCRDERSLTRVNDRGFAKEMKMYDFRSVSLQPWSGERCIWMKKGLQPNVCIYNPLKPVALLVPSDQ